jgi:hypothetical protein
MGVAVGTLVLGIGGRLAMRGIAHFVGQPPSFSLGGSVTVIFLGMVSGLVGAVVFVSLRVWLPRWRLLRITLFWVFLTLVTLRGLLPLDTPRLVLFGPLVVIYGVALEFLWSLRSLRRRREAHSAVGREAAA